MTLPILQRSIEEAAQEREDHAAEQVTEGADGTTDQGPGFREMDVLCGRGEFTNRHAGNIVFRAQKERFQPRYKRAKTRPEKTAMAQELVDFMEREYQSQFRAREGQDDSWYVVDPRHALEKAIAARKLDAGSASRKAPAVRGQEETFQTTAMVSGVAHCRQPRKRNEWGIFVSIPKRNCQYRKHKITVVNYLK
jgi:hypothetical protein